MGVVAPGDGVATPVVQLLVRCTVVSCAASVLVLGLGLFIRRLTTPLQPLSSLTLLAVGVLLAGGAAGLRRLWQTASHRNVPAPTAGPVFISTAILLLLGFSLSLPGTNPGSLLLFWLILVVGETSGWWAWADSSEHRRLGLQQSLGRLFRWTRSGRGALAGETGDARRWASGDSASSDCESSDAESSDCESSDAESSDLEAGDESDTILQRIVRMSQNGQDRLVGEYRCHWGEGERQQVVHAIFSPAFRADPQVEVRCVPPSPSVTLKPAQVECYGVRLEVRRRGTWLPPEPLVIELTAEAPLGPLPMAPAEGELEKMESPSEPGGTATPRI